MAYASGRSVRRYTVESAIQVMESKVRRELRSARRIKLVMNRLSREEYLLVLCKVDDRFFGKAKIY